MQSLKEFLHPFLSVFCCLIIAEEDWRSSHWLAFLIKLHLLRLVGWRQSLDDSSLHLSYCLLVIVSSYHTSSICDSSHEAFIILSIYYCAILFLCGGVMVSVFSRYGIDGLFRSSEIVTDIWYVIYISLSPLWKQKVWKKEATKNSFSGQIKLQFCT